MTDPMEYGDPFIEWNEANDYGDAERDDHLPYNPTTDRQETGGDEVDYADEGDGDQGDGDELEHCYHVDRLSDDDDWTPDDDDCVHCPCCCTCLGCEYGPRDGMLMFPEGVELP